MNLNSQQIFAVKSTSKSILIIAGAGTGKTAVLVNRIAYLVNELGIHPDNILAITFTNKASLEMQKRLKIMSQHATFSWIRTFHATCLKILLVDIDKIPESKRKKNFSIIDAEDQKNLISNIIKRLNLSISSSLCKKITTIVSLIKDLDLQLELNDPKNYFHLSNEFELPSNVSVDDIKKIYEIYEQELVKFNMLDFSDLLNLTNYLLKNNIDVRVKWQNKFQYILVDEFQDTNYKQFCILKYLINDENNIFAVGDPNQTIYTWRGAYPNIFNDYLQEFKNTKIIKLFENYRSNKKILNVANNLILADLNRNKTLDNMLEAKNLNENNVNVFYANSLENEANFIIRTIIDLHQKNNITYNQIAILYRINSMSRTLEDKLIANQIPYIIYGDVSFYDRKEIKDLIAYIKIIFNPDDISLARIINVPLRGIGNDTLQNLRSLADQQGISLITLTRNINQYPQIKEFIKKRIINFWLEIDDLKKQLLNTNLHDYLNVIINKIKYDEYLKNYDAGFEARLDNINELTKSIDEFNLRNNDNNIINFLNEISLYNSAEKTAEQNSNCVKLMTVHMVKGLEFDTVFIFNFNQGSMPFYRSLSTKAMQEERRIAYVAITRAINNLYLTCTKSLTMSNFYFNNSIEPSLFLKEIGEKNFTIVDHKINTLTYEDNSQWFNSKKIQHFNPDQYYDKNTKIIFQVGETVVHTLFGTGVITEINNNFLTIIFKRPYGRKTIIANHNSLKRLIS